MQKLHISLIILCVLTATLLISRTYVSAQKGKYFEKPSAQQITSRQAIFRPGHNQEDMAYAIVIMPKSYRSLLKRFSKHPLAKEIRIIPASMVWQEGNMVVHPKSSVIQSHRRVTTESAVPSINIDSSQKQPAVGNKTALDLALMALFLEGVSHKKKLTQ